MPLRRAHAFAAALLMATPLAAQQPQKPDSARKDSTRTLPPIEVVGSIRPAAGPAIGSNIPARITTLSAQEVDRYEPRILSDVLAQQAGFSAYDDLGSPYKLNVSSRGFYASPVVGLPQGISVFLDGVRMNEPDASQVNFDLLPMDHIKRVEILSGNGSLLGRNSLGGAINLITRRGEGPLGGDLEVSGGSFGAARIEASAGGTSRGGVDYFVGGGYNREDGWRQQTGAHQYNGFVSVGKLGERRGIRFQGFFSESYARTAGSLPESVYDVKPDSNLTRGDYEDLWALQGALSGYTAVGARGRASFITYLRRHEAERFNVNQVTDPDALGQSANTAFGYTLDYRWSGSLGRNPLGLRFGVDGSVNSTRVDLFADERKFGGDVEQTTKVESPVWDLAGFAMADLTTGRATWSAGLRLDHVEIPYRNLLDPSKDTTGVYNQLNPRVGLTLDLGGGWSAFGSWGRSFRAPSVIENACADPEEPCPLPFALGDDPPLKPVTASTVEFGGQFASSRVFLSGSVYRTAVSNDIFLTPYEEEDEPEGSTIDGYFINLDKSRREGVELSGRFLFGAGHSLYANYAWTRATFRSEAEIFSIRESAGGENEVEEGDRFPLVPDHQVKAGADFRIGRRLTLGVDGRYIGQQWLRGDEANEEKPLDAYAVADLRAGVSFGRWEVTGIVTNLFDSRYASFGGYNINQGAPGGPQLERFLTPGHARMFRLVVRTALGGSRGGALDLDD